MSTIASPRDPSSFPRRTHSSQNIITTPTSSTRPSMDAGSAPLSTQSSPTPSSTPLPTAPPAKRNRAALREYYNLKKTSAATTTIPGTPTLEITGPPSVDDADDFHSSFSSHSEIPRSELDSPDFDAETYVRQALQQKGLEDLLRLYARVLGEMRALDAEKKALVYDNYSKLIAATETIRRMRSGMDPLNPVASTLDPAVGRVYEMARGVREDMKRRVEGDAKGGEGESAERRRKRTREVVREVSGTPERMRELVRRGRGEEVRGVWEVPRRLLVRWKEEGFGGGDVDEVLREGDEVVRGVEEGSGSGSGSGEE
ncbi:Vps51/Vps67-domain-containing protein [Coniochaeta sp. 2T2.1]|nr:Vps51/Vps67-domain-containing protein [Coniochaeta sp. 2T2.1]